MPLSTPCPMFMIFDHTLFASGPLYEKDPRSGWTQIVERYDWSEDNGAELAKGWIKHADTHRRLWRRRWDSIPGGAGGDRRPLECALRCGRGCRLRPDARCWPRSSRRPSMRLSCRPRCSTRRAARGAMSRAQIVRPDGSPIPRLYSAGELGSIYSYLYQGTGNIGECLAFGRIAGRNAAAEQPWE